MNRRLSLLALNCLLLALGYSTTSRAQDAAIPVPGEKSKLATVKVEQGKLIVESVLKGWVVSDRAANLRLDMKSWAGPHLVKSAVSHGARVKKGQVILELDTTKIDIALRELGLDREIADSAAKQLKAELPILEKLLPLNLAAAERDQRIAEEDLKRYTEVEREHGKNSAEFNLKSQQHWLEYAQEELKQLQKMYRDKDLTEETEEIILKRQMHQIEQVEFMLSTQKLQQDRQLQLDLPRRDQQMEEAVAKAALAQQKAQSTLPLELEQKRLALRKLEAELAKIDERFKDLESDRSSMIVSSPWDGIACHGHAERGQWNTAAISGRLRPQGILQPNEAFMTVVTGRPLSLITDVEEKELHLLNEGLEGDATPLGFPALKFKARLKSVSPVPRAANNFEAHVALEVPESMTNVTPGMSVNAKFTTYRNEAAVLAPTSAIFRDEGSDQSHVLVMTDGEPVKTEVQIGNAAGGKTEIISGVKSGVEILAAKP